MNTKDITLYESGQGGEMEVVNDDLSMTESLFQQVYLALFGGNVEASTTGNELTTEERFDWWGNSVLFSDEPDIQFNSETERTLNTTALNSQGRLTIIRAVDNDLSFLQNIANFEVTASIISVNKIAIYVTLSSKDNQEVQEYQLTYDNAKNEVITQRIL